MAKLAIMTGKLQGQKMALPEKDIAIGRDDSCEIRLTGTEISRRHCQLRIRGDLITAKDLGSRNGCYVNDIKIYEETVLNHGDLLRVGSMVFRIESAPPKTETPIGKTKAELTKAEAPKSDASKPESSKASSKAKSPDYEHMANIPSPSEDSIVNWLIDDAGEGGGAGDTTIVPRSAEVSSMKIAPGAAAPAAGAASKAPPKKQFATVKEEAADIIRRHLESLNASS